MQPPPTEKLADKPRIIGPVPRARLARRSAPRFVPVFVGRSLAVSRGNHILVGWLLLLCGFLLACVPFAGLLVYVVGIPLCITSFALAVVAMNRGRALAGAILLLASITAAPAAFLVAPLVSSLLAGAAASH